MKIRIIKYFSREFSSEGGIYEHGIEIKKHWYSPWKFVYTNSELTKCQEKVEQINDYYHREIIKE